MRRFSPIQMILMAALVFLIGAGDLLGQTCPEGMISYWKLQERSGPTYVDSYGSNDAFAPEYAPAPTPGISGGGQEFSKTSSTYLTIPDDSDFDWGGSANWSIEFWVKYQNTGEVQVFLGRYEPSSQMQLWIGSDEYDNIAWWTCSSDGSYVMVTSTGSYANGEWHHVVAVRSGTSGRNYLYVDGVLQNAGGTPLVLGGTLSSSQPFAVGAYLYPGPNHYYLTGSLDEMAIYSRALDLALDITPHFNNLRLYSIGYCDGDDPKFLSEPVIEAQVGQLYYYDVDASGNSLPDYSLVEGPEGMTINATTGEITWTPSSITQNGHVIVRAHNDKGTVDQEFNVFIADLPSCRGNLIAYWDFDDADYAPYYDNVSNFELSGIGPVPVPGIVGEGLLFDGANDSLNMHDDFSPNRIFFDFDDVPNWSIEVWFKSSATPAKTMVLVGRYEGDLATAYWVGINPVNGAVGFFLSDWPDPPLNHTAYLEGGESVLDGQWHHVVASYSDLAQLVKLYLDGEEVDALSMNFYNFGGDSDLNIGCFNAAGADKYWFSGVIDELAFYNQQLSTARVQENYSSGMSGLGACVYNHAPVISSKPDTEVYEDDPYTYNIVAEELDPTDVLTISVPLKPSWLNFSYTPGNNIAILSGTPDNSHVGQTHNVLVRVSDGMVSVDQSFSIDVLNVNDPPEITSTNTVTELNQGDNYSYTVTATDEDGDELFFSAPVKPASFSFNADTHVLSGQPTNDDVGVIDITVRVSDGTDAVDQSFQITVIDVNDAPVITSTPVTEMYQGDDYSYTVIAVDPDGDELTYSAPQIPGWLSFDPNTHRLAGTTQDFEGVVDIVLEVTDGELVTEDRYQLEVLNVNDLPVITSTPITHAYVDQAYLYTITATDADIGDVLTFTAQTKPAWLDFIPASNSALLSGTPAITDKGTHPVIISVSDGKGSILHSFTINVMITSVETSESLIQRVYPNPAGDHVYFEMEYAGEITVVLYDVTGSAVLEESFGNTDQIKLDISDLPSNLYFYRIHLDDEVTVGKIIKE